MTGQLRATAGDVDFLGEVKGIGTFADVLRVSDALQHEGFAFHVLSIEGLIAAQSAAGRPKDAAGLIELSALREARSVNDDSPKS